MQEQVKLFNRLRTFKKQTVFVGALVINEEVEKFYLKQKTDKNRFKIKFDNIRKIEKDDFEKERNYFLGVEMPPANEL